MSAAPIERAHLLRWARNIESAGHDGDWSFFTHATHLSHVHPTYMRVRDYWLLDSDSGVIEASKRIKAMFLTFLAEAAKTGDF